MEIQIFEVKKQKIAEIISEAVEINNAQDALDIMANASYQGARSIIIHEKNLLPEFFELRSGLLGEVVQKFANYRVKLAVIGEFEKFQSKSLQAFIRESNRGNLAFFVHDKEAAMVKLGN